MRYAIIPQVPEDPALKSMAVVICRAMGLPEDNAHPASVDRVANIVADVYEAVFNAYGVPSP